MASELRHQFMWSNGEKPERSQKNDKPVVETMEASCGFNNRIERIDNYYTTNPYENIIHGENRKDCDLMTALNVTEKSELSRREDMNDKLTERMPVASISINPFLSQSNYVNDMEIRNNFLIPKNSNQNSNQKF